MLDGILKHAATKRAKSANDGDRVAASDKHSQATAEHSAATKRIDPLDVLTVWVERTLLDWPIQKRYLVEPGGGVTLGGRPFMGASRSRG